MDPFETFGIPAHFDLEAKDLERRFRELQKLHHPDRHAAKPPSERRTHIEKAVQIKEAYRVLRHDVTRGEAHLTLRAQGAATAAPAEDPAFLMEMMELREELADARKQSDRTSVERLSLRMGDRRADNVLELQGLFQQENFEAERTQSLLGRLRFYDRVLDEIEVAMDDLDDASVPMADRAGAH